MKIIEAIKSIPLIIFLLIMTPISFISKIFEKSIIRTNIEVEDTLQKMLTGKESDDLWDDFLSIPIKNKELDKIREKVEVLWAYDDFQEKNKNGKYVLNRKGVNDLNEIINELHDLKAHNKAL